MGSEVDTYFEPENLASTDLSAGKVQRRSCSYGPSRANVWLFGTCDNACTVSHNVGSFDVVHKVVPLLCVVPQCAWTLRCVAVCFRVHRGAVRHLTLSVRENETDRDHTDVYEAHTSGRDRSDTIVLLGTVAVFGSGYDNPFLTATDTQLEL